MNDRTPIPGRVRDLTGLAAFLILCFAVSAVGGAITASSVGTWYQGLAKPAFNPPDWIFAPVWTALYVMIAVAGWRVWRRGGYRESRGALRLFLYIGQLVLNVGWSLLFFGFRLPGAALVEIIVLLATVVATGVSFRRSDVWAAVLFAPYAAWVAFAATLNAGILILG